MTEQDFSKNPKLTNSINELTSSPTESLPKNDPKNEIISHKYNLFQQFFVIGLDSRIMYNINDIDLQSLPSEFLKPTIISKYPNQILPYINIPDSAIASHCFPKGIQKLLFENKDDKPEDFVFSLDNCSTIDLNSSLRTNKLYFSCLLFYEKAGYYKIFANIRKKTLYQIEEKANDKNKTLLIPKVICFSSFTPLFRQGKYLLNTIKRYIDYYNFNKITNSIKQNIFPIEKIIEGLIYNLPGLPRANYTLKLSKETFNYGNEEENDLINEINRYNTNKTNKTNCTNNNMANKHIIFEESPPNKRPRAVINYAQLMKFFRIEEIFQIIKHILFEECILFFCDNIQYLTYTIEGFVSLLYPFQYSYPVISVLPEENYSFINIFNHFIFGINCKYSEELLKLKNINLDGKKCVILIRIEERFNTIINTQEKDPLTYPVITTVKANKSKPIVKLEELNNMNINEENNNYVRQESMERKKSIRLPIHYSGKCCKKLEVSTLKKFKETLGKKNQKDLTDVEKDKIFNNEIIENFLYFFTCILLHYQDYIIKYNFNQNDKTYNRNVETDEKNYYHNLKINDMFDCVGFINATPYLDRPFYARFFETKIFYNFIKKKVFPMSVQDKLDVLFFDDKINEKLSRESNIKKIETKFIEDDLKNLSGEIVIGSFRKQINIEDKNKLSKKESCLNAINYFQYVTKDQYKSDPRISNIDENDLEELNDLSFDEVLDDEIKNANNDEYKFFYFVFPKLLNDGIFFKEKNIEDGSNEHFWTSSRNNFTLINSNCLYNQFEKEGGTIINTPQIIQNYKNYNYSLNPISSFQYKYEDYVNKLWLHFLIKSFHLIPFSKKKYYFDQMILFMKNYINIIKNNTLITIFNTIYKYGDRCMLQDLFIFLRNKTYTTFLLLKEKTEPSNNFVEFKLEEEIKAFNKFEFKNKNNFKMNFILNSYCMEKIDNENYCGEPFVENMNTIFDEQECFMQFECNKCKNKQGFIVTMFYEKGGEKYEINFRLVSPSTILKQKWFEDTNKFNLEKIRRDYLECYLSALFYFNQQGLVYDFLLLPFIQKKELQIESISKEYNEANKINLDFLKKCKSTSFEDKQNDNEENGVEIKNNVINLGEQSRPFFVFGNSSLSPEKKIFPRSTGCKKKTLDKKINRVPLSEFKLSSKREDVKCDK